MSQQATYAQRLARRAHEAPIALCVGIDPSPASLSLLNGIDHAAGGRRATKAGAIERFGGLLVEAARDHAIAIKPQVAWFEAVGAPGIRALERVVAYARAAGLLVVIDAKRGDISHTATAYAQAWLGEEASSGICGDALTINVSVGADTLRSFAQVAAERHCGLYALLHTSNPGAAAFQDAELADGRPWSELLAAAIREVDDEVGGGVVGAVVGATRPELLARVRELVPYAPLLLPGVGPQGGTITVLGRSSHGAAPTSLVPVSRAVLPPDPSSTGAFRHHVATQAAHLADEIAKNSHDQSQSVG